MAVRQLVFVQQPTRVRIPNAIWPPVRLEVRIGDRVDPRVIDGEVKLSILSGPPGGQIIGTSTARCPNGVATFDDLRFNVPGTYTLLAECDEDKLELAGLASHSSIMFLDMATVDEQNRLVCQRTGLVLTLFHTTLEPPIPIDSHLGEGTARRFIRNITSRWWISGSFPEISQSLANGAVIHALYRQYILAPPPPLGTVFGFLTAAAVWETRIAAGFASVSGDTQPRQEFRYGQGSIAQSSSNLENWSLLSLGAVEGVARCYINGTQSGPDFTAGTRFASPVGIHVGYDLTGDIAQIGVESVSSLEDMDAKALHAAQMCKVAP